MIKFLQLLLVFFGWILSTSALGFVTLNVCYDFGCRSQQTVTLSRAEWQGIGSLFDAGSATEERQQIKLALARIEQLVGRYTPTYRDLAMNLPLADSASDQEKVSGQLDCIDESINATGYLQMLEQTKMLRVHRVLDRAYRRSFLTQHWAAQIEDLQSGRRYVIDTWFEENGKLPVLVSSESWHDLSL